MITVGDINNQKSGLAHGGDGPIVGALNQNNLN